MLLQIAVKDEVEVLVTVAVTVAVPSAKKKRPIGA